MNSKHIYFSLFVCFALIAGKNASAQNSSTGIFDGQNDVGIVKHKGTALYDYGLQQYHLTGSGTNIWATHDEFHFVWKRMKGDFILRTNTAFIGKGIEEHRKIGWMVRTSLDTNSKQVSAAVHGNGLTSLQFRKTIGGITEEQVSKITAADVIQLERKGNRYTMSVARKGEVFIDDSVKVDLGDDVYVGLFVCAHNPNVVEQALFNNVRIIIPARENFVPYREYIGSDIEILNLETQNSKIIYQSPISIQAPNWMKDGNHLLYNSDGRLYTFDLKTSTPTVLNTGDVIQNNNDHVISFDGKWLAISSKVKTSNSAGYVMPITGGQPRLITKLGPSYMHSWSPDRKWLIYTGGRNDEFDIYKTAVEGGEEINLTKSPGLDDGPEYTPDGKYIFFNSVRTGLMQIWRMKPDGSEQTQITNDDNDNWFPHISPDGKWIVYISFLKNEVQPAEHPFYRHVYVKLMPVTGGQPKVIAYVYGGQGTINTPSWSPDSKHIALVSNTSLLFPVFPVAK